MAELKFTSKTASKNVPVTNSAGQATKLKTPKEIFDQLIGKADHLPSDLSTKKSRVLTEQ